MADVEMKRMFQIGMTVPDALAAAKTFCKIFSVDEAAIKVMDGRNSEPAPMLYKGVETRAVAIIASVLVANVEFEFVQYYGGDSNFHSEFLAQHGAGISHICVDVNSYPDAVDAMLAAGGQVINDGGQGDYSFKYIGLQEQTGIVFELMNDGLRDMMMGNNKKA